MHVKKNTATDSQHGDPGIVKKPGKYKQIVQNGDDSDEQAMMDHCGNDFTAYIVSFRNGSFYCSAGMPWSYAVPIKISVVRESEVAM